MQAKTLLNGWRLAGAITLAGIIAAVIAAFALPGPYLSSSVVRTPVAPGERSVDPKMPDSTNWVWQQVISRSSLSEIIRRSALDLYRSERDRIPLEDAIVKMRSNIRLERVDDQPSFRISFTYPDAQKAKQVADILTLKLQDGIQQDGGGIEILHIASAPSPQPPDRLGFLERGLFIGAILGIVAAFFRWRAFWTLKVLGFGLLGFVASAFLFFYTNAYGLIPVSYTSNATVQTRPYTSDSTRRMLTGPELAAWLQRCEKEILSRPSLAELIQRPAVNLYSRDRRNLPLEDVVAEMRKNIAIELLPAKSAFRISFTYPDRFKTQRVVSALVTEFADRFQKDQAIARLHQVSASDNSSHWSKDGSVAGCSIGDQYDLQCLQNLRKRPSLDLLEPANLPNHMWPEPESVQTIGAIIGLLLGAALLRPRQPPTEQNI